MKTILLFFGLVFCQERLKEPSERLADIQDGLNIWVESWIPQFRRKRKLMSKTENLVNMVHEKLGKMCAESGSEEDGEHSEDEKDDTARISPIDTAVDRMKKYFRVISRINRIHLRNCRQTEKIKRLSDKLATRFADAFKNQNPAIGSIGDFMIVEGAKEHGIVNGLYHKMDKTNEGKVVYKHALEDVFLHSDGRNFGNWHFSTELEGGETFYWAFRNDRIPLDTGIFKIAGPDEFPSRITIYPGVDMTDSTNADFLIASMARKHPEVNGIWKRTSQLVAGKASFKHMTESIYLYSDSRDCCHGNWHMNSNSHVAEDPGTVFYWSWNTDNFPVEMGGFFIAETDPPKSSYMENRAIEKGVIYLI